MQTMKFFDALSGAEYVQINGEIFQTEYLRLPDEHTVPDDILLEAKAGETELSFTQDDVVFEGHAIECRINAENPRTFMPSPGLVSDFHAPGGLGVRLDSALYAGYSIPPYYDSLAGKLIVHMTHLYAFDPATGKQLWVNTEARCAYGTPSGLRQGDVDAVGGAVVDGNVVDGDVAGVHAQAVVLVAAGVLDGGGRSGADWRVQDGRRDIAWCRRLKHHVIGRI